MNKPASVSNRYLELDSTRGLAALSVVFHHFLLIFPIFFIDTYSDKSATVANLLKYNPLHIFWAGHEAVIFFFILSGFVLSLPFYSTSTKKFQYAPFLLKRVFRIYLPYLVAVILAILLKALFYSGPIPDLSSWFNTNWHNPTDLTLIGQHLLLIGGIDADALDTATWSLVYEMRVSIIFPLLMFFVIKFKWQLVLGVTIVLPFVLHYLPYEIYSNFQYGAMFVVGALLAKYRFELINFYQKLNGVLKAGLLVAAILGYTYSWLFYNQSILHSDMRDGWIITGGASILVIMALGSHSFQRVLHNRYVLFLGKISYSLYLYHAIIMLSMVHELYGKLPIFLVLALAFCISLGVAIALYYLVEQPSIRYGRFLAERLFSVSRSTTGANPIVTTGFTGPSLETSSSEPPATLLSGLAHDRADQLGEGDKNG